MLFRLSIRKLPGGASHTGLGPEDRGELYLAVAHGLSDGIIRYLWRNRVEAQAGMFTPRSPSAFDDHARERGYMWIRARALPERILALFLGTPGIDVFKPAGANAAVAVGYAHPIDLASCRRCSRPSTFHVFWPGDRVDVLPGPLALSDIGDLTRVDIELERREEPVGARGQHAGRAGRPIGVELKLAAAMGPPRRVVATLIPLAHGSRLKRILFALPPVSLRGHRVAITDRGILVVGSENLDVVPLGQLLCELTPGCSCRSAWTSCRACRPTCSRARSATPRAWSRCSSPDGTPFQVGEGAFQTLERRALAKLEVDRAEVDDYAAEAPAEAQVVNDAVGRFALWGFPDAPDRKLLPPGAAASKSGDGEEAARPPSSSTRFVRPLVAGGELHVGAPIPLAGRRAAGTVELGNASVELGRGRRRARRRCCRRSSCGRPRWCSTRDELTLAAGLHDALFLVHPRADRWTVTDRAAPPHHRHRADAGQPAADRATAPRAGAPRAAPQPVPLEAQRHHGARGGRAARASMARRRRRA